MRLQATRAASPPTLQIAGRYGDIGITGLEVVTGAPLGDGEPARLDRPATDPVVALERALLAALRRPPCVVAFSGGRDSSVLLALAARLAEREGLDAPVAVTQRFPGVGETDEAQWQELVVRHIGIADWETVDHGDGDLDIVGGIAQRVLSRHGPAYPMNAHFALPLVERARGGTVVTGLDGDTIFGTWRWGRVGDVLSGRSRPRPRDAVTAVHRLAPYALQQAILRRRHPGPPAPWLTPEVNEIAVRHRMRNLRMHPRRFDAYMAQVAGSRHIRLMADQLDLIAGDAGARMAHPFLDSGFLSALALSGGRRGLGGRTEIMGALFGGTLPDRLLRRRTKASFTRVYLGEPTRALGRVWDGSGLDPDIVDADALRAVLVSDTPAVGAALLAQWLWLSQARGADA